MVYYPGYSAGAPAAPSSLKLSLQDVKDKSVFTRTVEPELTESVDQTHCSGIDLTNGMLGLMLSAESAGCHTYATSKYLSAEAQQANAAAALNRLLGQIPVCHEARQKNADASEDADFYQEGDEAAAPAV
jgi:hypothetical protein